jgi:NAD(P)-dependent dehydrogenase (short-subunit alcohol dehydrogenase family)
MGVQHPQGKMKQRHDHACGLDYRRHRRGSAKPSAQKWQMPVTKVAVTFSPSEVWQWLAAMKKEGYTFTAVPCDVTDFESSKACVATVTSQVGAIDILVNNAGITKDMTFRKTQERPGCYRAAYDTHAK